MIFLSAFILLNSCDVLKQVGGAYNLSQCKYTYNSINDLELAGVQLNNKRPSFSIADIATLTTILTGGTMQNIPFSMTLNLNIENPNKVPAYLNGLEYMIEVNDMEFTTGQLNKPINVGPGEESVIPLSIGVDLRNLINRYSKDKVASEMGRFIGLSPGGTKVTVKLRPKILVGNVPISSPTYIPVSFQFGGQ